MAKEMFKEEIKTAIKDLESPVPIPSGALNFFKKGKIRCVFHYEDGSYHEVYKKFKKSYFIEYKNKLYQVVPKCISRGKYPMIQWYYNNPAPILPKYQSTKLTAEKLHQRKNEGEEIPEKEKTYIANTYIDAEALHSAFSSNMLKGLYSSNKLSAKSLIIIAIVGFVMLLIILQLTGTVDVIGAFTTGK